MFQQPPIEELQSPLDILIDPKLEAFGRSFQRIPRTKNDIKYTLWYLARTYVNTPEILRAAWLFSTIPESELDKTRIGVVFGGRTAEFLSQALPDHPKVVGVAQPNRNERYFRPIPRVIKRCSEVVQTMVLAVQLQDVQSALLEIGRTRTEPISNALREDLVIYQDAAPNIRDLAEQMIELA